MKDKMQLNSPVFDAAIEELLSGNLDSSRIQALQQAAASDQAMAAAIIDAWTIRRSLDELETETVSPALEKRLLAIPAQQASQKGWLAWLKPANWQTGPSWAIASTLAMSLILAIGISRQPDPSEILQARQDIQIALIYLGKSLNHADQLTRNEISLQVQKILANQQRKPKQHIDEDTHTKPDRIDL